MNIYCCFGCTVFCCCCCFFCFCFLSSDVAVIVAMDCCCIVAVADFVINSSCCCFCCSCCCCYCFAVIVAAIVVVFASMSVVAVVAVVDAVSGTTSSTPPIDEAAGAIALWLDATTSRSFTKNSSDTAKSHHPILSFFLPLSATSSLHGMGTNRESLRTLSAALSTSLARASIPAADLPMNPRVL